MPVVPEHLRVPELRRLQLSEPLIRLASGDCIHEMFRDACLGPPYRVYHGARTPDGPPLVPLWEYCDSVFGVWERGDGIEFIDYDVEAPNWPRSLAGTEQGFWVTRFDFHYECEVPLGELREAAAVVGFRFLDRHIAAREAAEGRLGTFEGHQAWLRALVESVDRDSGCVW